MSELRTGRNFEIKDKRLELGRTAYGYSVRLDVKIKWGRKDEKDLRKRIEDGEERKPEYYYDPSRVISEIDYSKLSYRPYRIRGN